MACLRMPLSPIGRAAAAAAGGRGASNRSGGEVAGGGVPEPPPASLRQARRVSWTCPRDTNPKSDLLLGSGAEPQQRAPQPAPLI